MTDSNSSVRSTPAMDRVREWIALARLSIADAGTHDFSDLENSYRQHDEVAQRYLGRPLTQCRVVEIGYGARPNRLIWFFGQGVEITGIDLDQPVLYGRPAEFLRVLRRNGWERALKTVARWFINERGLRRAMLGELSARRGKKIDLPAARLAVGDASGAEFWAGQRGVDYIFSEDVFEHIPAVALEGLVARMAASMAPEGVAFIKPMVYTGICGGHHVEWYPHTFSQPMDRMTEPWEHLRQNRHKANTYLNGLPLAGYRDLFGRYFEILEETVAAPGLGQQFMTPELRAELAAYPEDELFSNAVIFVLRPLAKYNDGDRR